MTELFIDESESYEMCSDNGMIYQEAGMITSPGYPNNYLGNQKCQVMLYNDFTHCVSNIKGNMTLFQTYQDVDTDRWRLLSGPSPENLVQFRPPSAELWPPSTPPAHTCAAQNKRHMFTMIMTSSHHLGEGDHGLVVVTCDKLSRQKNGKQAMIMVNMKR